DLRRQRQLAEGKRPFEPILLGDRPFNDEGIQIGASGVDGSRPSGRPRADNRDAQWPRVGMLVRLRHACNLFGAVTFTRTGATAPAGARRLPPRSENCK